MYKAHAYKLHAHVWDRCTTICEMYAYVRDARPCEMHAHVRCTLIYEVHAYMRCTPI